MYSSRRDKKDDEDGSSTGYTSPQSQFKNLDKGLLLQESRIFNDTPVRARTCTNILTKILYILNQGETFKTADATQCFFAITRLFQSKDVVLRRLVYLGIKVLASTAEDVIIVTSSLTKDMTGKEDMYRAAAIRALCTVTDASMLQAIERYMKQALVDKSPAVASAALVSALHMASVNKFPVGNGGGNEINTIVSVNPSMDVIKRWVNEAQEAVNQSSLNSQMVQYHALGVLYEIRKSDKLGVIKLVTKTIKNISSLKTPFAVCFLIRISASLIEQNESKSETESSENCNAVYFDFIEHCLRHKSEIVIYEAARAIVSLKNVTKRELVPAISVLQLFCSSPKATLRFAAVRTLNQVSTKHPAAVTTCNLDLENLITDSNRSIATLAITTLLKTGSENSVDRLMKQISSFVNEISDEFKVVVVSAIKSLCSKFPRKHGVLINFLSSMLREDGGVEYKSSIAETIISILEENSEARENCLAHLCEFIEDCEHSSLAIRILHLIGTEGPKTSNPSRYIRYVYNRVILENAPVRAAAVSALARFGALCDDLLPNILVLLARCQMDTDDEVRDRATYFRAVLEEHQDILNSQYILNGLQVSLSSLERALHSYTMSGECERPFDLKTVALAVDDEGEGAGSKSKKTDDLSDMKEQGSKSGGAPQATRHDMFVEKLNGVTEIREANCGPLFKSSQPVQLTESETEYVVQCIKHVFPNHVILQFDCHNTLNDQLLSNVYVQVEVADGFTEISNIPCEKLEYNVSGTTYIILQTPSDLSEMSSAVFTPTLKFVVHDCDPSTGEVDPGPGYPDEYGLEDVELNVSDYMQRAMKANFQAAWSELSASGEKQGTYSLTAMNGLEEAVKSITSYLGMQACERSERVQEGKSSHVLFLSGVFKGGDPVLVCAKFALSDGVNMHLTVKSTNEELCDLIVSSIE